MKYVRNAEVMEAKGGKEIKIAMLLKFSGSFFVILSLQFICICFHKFWRFCLPYVKTIKQTLSKLLAKLKKTRYITRGISHTVYHTRYITHCHFKCAFIHFWFTTQCIH